MKFNFINARPLAGCNIRVNIYGPGIGSTSGFRRWPQIPIYRSERTRFINVTMNTSFGNLFNIESSDTAIGEGMISPNV